MSKSNKVSVNLVLPANGYSIGVNNLGSDNVGNRNVGNRNSGDCNIGHFNAGTFNVGNGNAGDCNKGDCNAGDYNFGHANMGSGNYGDNNVGDGNHGNFNMGCCNLGDGHIGIFNTGDSLARVMSFGMPVSMSVLALANKLPVSLAGIIAAAGVIYVEDMTPKEKRKKKHWQRQGGFVRRLNSLEVWETIWEHFTEEDRQQMMALPNFCPKIFGNITGIDIDAW